MSDLNNLYSQEIVLSAARNKKKRLYQLAIFIFILLIAALLLFFLRKQIFTILLTIVCGSFIIFWWDAFAAADINYFKFIEGVTTGLHRSESGVVLFADTGTSDKNGVAFFMITVQMKDGVLRQLYIDKKLNISNMIEGANIEYEHVGNTIVAYKILDL